MIDEDSLLDRPVALYPLTYLADGDEVTVGRRDVDSYAILPPDGAALVRQLADGMTPRAAADWYQRTYGEQVDMLDMLGALDEMGFLRAAAEPAPDVPDTVRWQRLGQLAFSWPAWTAYVLLIAAAVVVMVRDPNVVPRYQDIFFTHSYSTVELVTFLGQFPLLLIHESYHVLAGRRLGLRSTLSIGRRLYFVVFETALDGLVTVPKRKRVLPILAGMVADLLVMAVLILLAAGVPGLAGRICMALAYGTLLRVIWQFYFYLRTDLYVMFTTSIGCVDLHTVSLGVLRNTWRRLTRRPTLDESAWHPTDRRVARWYAWFVLIGYVTTLLTFALAVVPIAYRFLSGVIGRFVTSGSTFAQLLDSGVFVGLNAAQVIVITALAVRDRRQRAAATKLQHVVG